MTTGELLARVALKDGDELTGTLYNTGLYVEWHWSKELTITAIVDIKTEMGLTRREVVFRPTDLEIVSEKETHFSTRISTMPPMSRGIIGGYIQRGQKI